MKNAHEKPCESCLTGKKYIKLDPTEIFCPYVLCFGQKYCPRFVPEYCDNLGKYPDNEEKEEKEKGKNRSPGIDTDVKK